MSNNQERRIVISLEISVPQCAGTDAPQFNVRRLAEPELARTIHPEIVHWPQSGQNYPVKLQGSGLGIICVRGDGFPHATEVRGCCYQGTPTDNDPPVNADSAAIIDTFWQLDAVPQAAVGFNVLRVWYLASGIVLGKEDRSFIGYASTHTFCEGGGFGGPPPLSPTRVYLPSQLTVRACGFSKEVGCFNGTWTLLAAACLEDAQRAVWRAAGCDESIVELVADLQQASATLTFRRQTLEIRYRKAAGQWNPANVADFADVSCRAIAPSASIPAIVQVYPGSAQCVDR